jgi:hypothetical protein
MIRPNDGGRPVSPSWVQVYQELVEWAVLFALLKKDFGTDTLIVCDGLLRSKVFAKDLFARLRVGIKDRIDAQWTRSKRKIYLAGVSKHSKVLTRYRLAMALEGVMQVDYPAYVEVHARSNNELMSGPSLRAVTRKLIKVAKPTSLSVEKCSW